MNRFSSQRKSYMTLLETLIAMSLLSMLLVFVFGFFRELSELTRVTEQAQKKSFQMRYLESRLGFIFERLVNEKATARKFFFYTEPPNRHFSPLPSLVLTFNNEVRLDPHFSSDVLGRLYVDMEGRLCLALWPLHLPKPFEHFQEEVLMDHVVNLSYSFYAPPEPLVDPNQVMTGKKIDSEKISPEKDQWHEEWLLSYNQMPSIMKMVIEIAKTGGEHPGSDRGTYTMVLHFVLPSSKNYIYYPPIGSTESTTPP